MPDVEILDRAAAAREVATFVALVLIETRGDADAALAICDGVPDTSRPQDDELDCATIGAQAIRDALGLREEAPRGE